MISKVLPPFIKEIVEFLYYPIMAAMLYSIMQTVGDLESNQKLTLYRLQEQERRLDYLEQYHRNRYPDPNDKVLLPPKDIMKPDQRLDPRRKISLVKEKW